MTTLIPKFDLKDGGSTPAGAVNRPINQKLSDSISVLDFGADPTGVADSTLAFTNAATYTPTGDINVPVGTYKITGNAAVAGNFVCTGAVDIPVVGSTTVATNVRSGLQSLAKNTTGQYNTAIGRWSMVNNLTGDQNSAYGVDSLYSNTSGFGNVALGSHAMVYFTTGNNNVGIGIQALEGASAGGTGDDNVAVGAQSMSNITSADQNVAIGANALLSTTSGSFNVAIGALAGYTGTPANANVTGDSNTWVGYGAGPSTSTQLSNTVAIGKGANVSAINSVQIGNNSLPNMTAQLGDGSTFKVSINGVETPRVILQSLPPASAIATGTAGTITWDSGYIYVCTATDTWKRSALSSW